MNKNLIKIVGLLLSCGFLFIQGRADWKSEVNQYLKEQKYAEARNLVEINLSKLENVERQEALALLPYLCSQNHQAKEEKQAIINYFEEYGNSLPTFEFLDFSIFGPILDYWEKWKEGYPLISNLNFLVPVSSREDTIPDTLRLGFDLSTEAYYKIQLAGQPLEGGWWSQGPHLIQLPLPFSFDQSINLDLDIFLKTDSITIKKRIVLEFKAVAKNFQNPDFLVQRQTAPPVKNLSGELALYIGDSLIYKSTKYLETKIPLKITIPPPNPPGTKPYLIPQKDQYQMHGVSIIDAVSAIAKAIKDWKKKPTEKAPSSYLRRAEINFTFINPEKQEIKTEVNIRMKPEKAEVEYY
ncbi:MAG: hypothetical protein ACPLZD_06875 [Candidatus Saccharicenans sp.]